MYMRHDNTSDWNYEEWQKKREKVLAWLEEAQRLLPDMPDQARSLYRQVHDLLGMLDHTVENGDFTKACELLFSIDYTLCELWLIFRKQDCYQHL